VFHFGIELQFQIAPFEHNISRGIEAQCKWAFARGDRQRPRLRPENAVILANKSDLLAVTDLISALQGIPSGVQSILISAQTGAGFNELAKTVELLADAHQLELGADLVAINARHANALAQARNYLADAITKVLKSDAVELLASDLRGTLSVYGEIVGRVDSERVLDHLFASFCIGK